ncbi:MAG: hypothetical protein IT580_01400 [Verrucomicrobiales bacterium]|nr:hypothetical protein [Verrucomicrobiales bacterium]
MNRVRGLLGIAVLVAWTGCGDASQSGRSSSAGSTNASSSGNPLTAPVDYLGAVGKAQQRSAQVVDMANLTHAIQAFQAGEERLPATLQDLVTEGYLPRLPVAPKGTQFAYQPQTGQLRLVPAPAAPAAPVGTPSRPTRP